MTGFEEQKISPETERDLLKKIASFFSESEKALELLEAHFKNGKIIDECGEEIDLHEFLERHEKAYERRQEHGVAHDIVILERELRGVPVRRGTGTRHEKLPDIDKQERRRDEDYPYQGRFGKFESDSEAE